MPFSLPGFAIGSLLIVDDSAVQREHAASMFRGLGVELIYEAGNGHEALALLAMLRLPPSLLLIDLEMPGMDGIELIQQLHQRELKIPFIVASSRELVLISTVEAMAASLGLQVLAGLQKPLRVEAIRNALLRHSAAFGASPRGQFCAVAPVDAEMLGRALADHQISVHYQPKVDVRSGIVRGVEALARWQHPTLGGVGPDVFIPLAERSGHIHQLTLSVLAQSLSQTAAWNARGLKLSVAVNLSPCLLSRCGLVADIAGLLERHAMTADQVVLEITESSVVDQLGSVLGALARLRLKGFGLSIDDYGTGFSSMQQLARIPFTELKIDRSFVHGAHRHQHLRVILQSALHMARQLDLVTVAEGIETLEDWRLLQEFGCNVGQGYLIAKPMPADALLTWLKSHGQRLHELRAEAHLAAISMATAAAPPMAATP